MSSKLMPPKVADIFLTIFIISSVSCVSRHIGTASISANSLNSTALPSITGIAASAPILPRPSTAEPSLMTATVLPLEVYLYTSSLLFLISRQGCATPGVYASASSCLPVTATLLFIAHLPFVFACNLSDSL